MNDVTRILLAIERGDPQATEQLLPLVYEGLRALAEQKLAQENPGRVITAAEILEKVGANRSQREHEEVENPSKETTHGRRDVRTAGVVLRSPGVPV